MCLEVAQSRIYGKEPGRKQLRSDVDTCLFQHMSKFLCKRLFPFVVVPHFLFVISDLDTNVMRQLWASDALPG